jgi:hypothetical protein
MEQKGQLLITPGQKIYPQLFIHSHSPMGHEAMDPLIHFASGV